MAGLKSDRWFVTPREKSAGAVIFRHDKRIGKTVYLILHYHFKGDYWDFPRGKIERAETEDETARREIMEETGLGNIRFVPGFREVTNWFYRWKGRNVYKEAVYFLAESQSGKVKLSHEHLEFIWADFDSAMDTLTYKNTKNILKKAHDFLQKEVESGKTGDESSTESGAERGIEKFLKDK